MIEEAARVLMVSRLHRKSVPRTYLTMVTSVLIEVHKLPSTLLSMEVSVKVGEEDSLWNPDRVFLTAANASSTSGCRKECCGVSLVLVSLRGRLLSVHLFLSSNNGKRKALVAGTGDCGDGEMTGLA